MDKRSHTVSRWNDMGHEILVEIFQRLDILELISGKAHVCKAWRLACSDSLIWRTLNLDHILNEIPSPPPDHKLDSEGHRILTRVSKISLSLSRGNIESLIFSFNLSPTDDQLTYIAERCPQLKRLVLPNRDRLTKMGICKAIQAWPNLESLTMPTMVDPMDLMEKIERCKNLRELKIMGKCDIFFASILASYLPELKVFSLRCSHLTRDALIYILDCFPKLEILNISHCVLEVRGASGREQFVKKLDNEIIQKASRLKEFLSCMEDMCLLCQWTKLRLDTAGPTYFCNYWEGMWNRDMTKLKRSTKTQARMPSYKEGLWKRDEIRSLDL